MRQLSLSVFLIFALIFAVFSGGPVCWADDPPQATPAAMASDWQYAPDAAAAASDAQADSTAATAPPVAPDGGRLGWLLGILGSVLALARMSSTANPLARTIFAGLDLVWKVLAPKYAQDAEAKRDQSDAALARLVAYIDEIDAQGGTAKQVKALVMKRLPSALSDRVDEILDLVRSRPRPVSLVAASTTPAPVPPQA